MIKDFKIGNEELTEDFEVSGQAFEEIQKRRQDVKNGNYISFEAAKKQFK